MLTSVTSGSMNSTRMARAPIACLFMLLWLAVRPAMADPGVIQPGQPWLDDRGTPIQAHGGGITKVDDTYYWFGEDRSEDNPPGIPVISCYSSKDLVNWTYRNKVEKADDPAKLGPGWILERPKVFHNARTNKYVMYAHIDDKSYRYA